MSLTRVALNSTESYSGAYYLFYNPSQLQLNASEGSKPLEMLDGGVVFQKPYFDSRPYTLTWSNLPINLSVNGSLSRQIATLQAYLGSTKYVHFGDIDFSTPSLGWTKIRVSDLNITINKGGSIKKNITLTLTPEN